MKVFNASVLALALFAPCVSHAMYCDDETDLVYYGYRYYNPTGGRWLSRDPAEEDQGGPNLYGFVGNDAVNGTDAFGLWRIFRDPSQSWAKAYTDCSSDTVASLAQLIYLDIGDAKAWLKGWKGGDPTAALPIGTVFQVPNAVGVYTAEPGLFENRTSAVARLRNRAADYGLAYMEKGYDVTQLLNKDDTEQFINMWQADGIYAVIFAGHGSTAGFEAQPSAKSGQVDPSQVHPPYKLQAVLALACYSHIQKGPNGETWASYRSHSGSYIGFRSFTSDLIGWVEIDINTNNIPPK